MRIAAIAGMVLSLMDLSMGMAFASTDLEKDQYHLFNPVPRERMRDLSTDRPDKTESPYTVDAGHFQIEASLIDYSYDHRNPEGSDQRVDHFSVMPMNLKAGLWNSTDLQFLINPYEEDHSAGDGESADQNGFGDIRTRVKINIWGNDGGPTAFAFMPFIKFPTSTDDLGNDFVEGGIILPLAVALPGDWNMGVMTEFDFNRNSEKDFYTDFINSITFGHQIVGDLNGYVEFFSSFNQEEDSEWVGTVDAGLTYAVSQNIQLDGGVNIGVTRSADDFNPFLGCSVRY